MDWELVWTLVFAWLFTRLIAVGLSVLVEVIGYALGDDDDVADETQKG